MYGPAFGVNNFNKPKMYSESETTANNIMSLLYGVPGFYPSIPDLGMNIGRLLDSFMDDIDTESIKVELATQCNKFIKNIRDGSFDVEKTTLNGNPLLIFVIPVTIKQVPKRVGIGITTDIDGNLTYRVTYTDDE